MTAPAPRMASPGWSEAIALTALAIVGWIFWRLHQRLAPAPARTLAPGDPPGSNFIPLGQFAVAPDRRWLLIKPGT